MKTIIGGLMELWDVVRNLALWAIARLASLQDLDMWFSVGS